MSSSGEKCDTCNDKSCEHCQIYVYEFLRLMGKDYAADANADAVAIAPLDAAAQKEKNKHVTVLAIRVPIIGHDDDDNNVKNGPKVAAVEDKGNTGLRIPNGYYEAVRILDRRVRDHHDDAAAVVVDNNNYHEYYTEADFGTVEVRDGVVYVPFRGQDHYDLHDYYSACLLPNCDCETIWNHKFKHESLQTDGSIVRTSILELGDGVECCHKHSNFSCCSDDDNSSCDDDDCNSGHGSGIWWWIIGFIIIALIIWAIYHYTAH